MSRHNFFVAQIFNLPYRRIAFGRAPGHPVPWYIIHGPRIANPRYGGLQTCATATAELKGA
jgi:hypothetical protein